jgi:hypothetical protein
LIQRYAFQNCYQLHTVSLPLHIKTLMFCLVNVVKLLENLQPNNYYFSSARNLQIFVRKIFRGLLSYDLLRSSTTTLVEANSAPSLALIMLMRRIGRAPNSIPTYIQQDARTQHVYHHDTKVKPEAATAIIELLMMGGKTPETC